MQVIDFQVSLRLESKTIHEVQALQQPLRVAVMDAVPEIFWHHDLGITDSQKFIDLLQPMNDQARFDVYYASKDEFPQSLDDYDALLVTGSPCSVHDQDPWIARLAELIRTADERGLRIIASCFGHQLVARTYGGEVGHNEGGWMIGNYPVYIDQRHNWMQPPAEVTGVYHFNQERVTRLPEQAVAYARTDDYDDFGFTIGDNILCIQGHPEQPHRAMVNFLDSMEKLPAEQGAKARARIDDGKPDAHIWAEWMMRFYTRS